MHIVAKMCKHVVPDILMKKSKKNHTKREVYAVNKRGVRVDFDSKLRRILRKNKLRDPIELLILLSNGVDVSGNSVVYEWILQHERYNGDNPPGEAEWQDLVRLIKNHCRYEPVSVSTKLQAQKTLAEYEHNKRKSIEILDEKSTDTVTELSIREIKKFERYFKNEY